MDEKSEKFLPFSLGYWTKDMEKRAFHELGECEDTRNKGLQELRTLLRDDKDLFCRMDDEFLLMFLRTKKFRVKDTRLVIRNYFRTRKDYPELFAQPKYERYMQNYVNHVFDVMPYRDKDGAVITIFHLENWDLNEQTFSDMVHTITVNAVVCASIDVATQLCGIKYIMNLKGVSLRHLTKVNFRHFLLVIKGMRDHLPVRVRGIHIYGASPLIAYVWKILRRVATEKMRNRFHFHSNESSLLQHFDPAVIPKELGGNLVYDNSFFMKLEHRVKELYTEGFYETDVYGYMK